MERHIEPDPEPGSLTAADAADLEAEGWIRRFTVAPDRLKETVALYEATGHDVRLERVSADELPETCEGCMLAISLFRVVYTRRKA